MSTVIDPTPPDDLVVATPVAAVEVDDHPPASIIGRLARWSAWTVAGYVATAGSGLVVSVIVARRLGPSGFGSYSYYMWLYRYAAILGAFGLPAALARFGAGALGAGDPGGARGIFRLGVRVQVLVAPLVLVATTLFAWSKADDAALALGLGAACTVLTFLLLMEGALTGLRRFRLLARNATITASAQLGLIGAGALGGVGWRGFVFLQILLAFLAVLWWSISTGRAFRAWPTRNAEGETRRAFLRFAGMMGVIALSDSILWGRPELFFLERWGSRADVGLYSAALVMASLTSSIPLVASRVFLPEFSWLLAGKRSEALRRAFPMLCTSVAVIAVPLGIFGALLSSELISLGYGGSFATAASAASIVMAGSIFVAVAGPASAATSTGPRPAVLAKIAAGFAVLNLMLDAAFIPAWGITGAAVASTSAQVVSVVVVIRYVDRRLGLRYPWATLARLVAIAAAAGLLAKVVAIPFSGAVAPAAGVAAGLMLYGAAIHGIGIVRWSQLRTILDTPSP